MSPFAFLILAVSAVALLALPRRFAPLPLLIGACYIPIDQTLEIGPISLPVVRILVAIGVARVAARGERIVGGLNRLDWLLIAWGAWACVSSLFHEPGSVQNRLGLVCDSCGLYFLIRVFCRSIDDVLLLCKLMAIALVPVALEMVYEHFTSQNLFSRLSGMLAASEVREGRVRANGPFAHAILAGTVGAAVLPLMIACRRSYKNVAMLGIAACLAMVLMSASSSPIISCAGALAALAMWKVRDKVRAFRWAAVFAYVALDVVMKAPAYYLLARIDLAGGSTGWHRARLIEAAFEHIGEWWLIGTDYTRHWMAYGIGWSPNHIDVTNYYLKMGVFGGLPLMMLFIAFVFYSFALVGQGLKTLQSNEHRFLLWSLGAAMFSHATTSISVSYFDQTFVFFYLIPAAIASASFSGQPVGAGAETPAPTKRRDFGRVPDSSYGETAPSKVHVSRPMYLRGAKR